MRNSTFIHRRHSLGLLTVAIVAGLRGWTVAAEPIADADGYVFSYFKGNGEDGLHLAWSPNGLVWDSLNADQPLTSPAVGGKLMRDPSIVRGPDGVYHMVWSSGWSDLGFGYSSSKDLMHWSEHRFLPVNEKVAGAKNTWAPDLFCDAATKKFVMTYATTIPGRFPETDAGGDQNHRLYWVMTRDFVTFSEPALALDPGYNCIDGTIVAMNGGLTMIYKDERPGQKKLHAVTTTGLGESWTKSTAPILERDWVEGPTVLKVGDVWRLYFDCYNDGHFGAAESSDGIHWRDITASLKMPHRVRHGTVFAVPVSILQPLRELTGR